MIKNIEEFKKYNIICTTAKEVEECLNMLNTEEQNRDIINDNYQRIVYYSKYSNKYILSPGAQLDNDISFYHFKKVYNRLKKQEKEKKQELPDFECDENGRIIKINNYKSDKKLYIVDGDYLKINHDLQKDWENRIKLGIVFNTLENKNNYEKYLTIHTKLKNIAERLNNGRKIDWKNERQPKFNINYNFIDYKKMYCNVNRHYKSQGTIYCLDENFLEVAKQEIGEEDLKWYLQQSY